MEKGRILIVSAPSGSGKSTIVNYLRQEHPEFRLAFSVSATSRLPRGTEQDGVDYYFYDSGAMAVGWINVGYGDYRYAKSSGALRTSAWVKSSGKWYYLKADGLMARNEYVDSYWVNDSGAWVK